MEYVLIAFVLAAILDNLRKSVVLWTIGLSLMAYLLIDMYLKHPSIEFLVWMGITISFYILCFYALKKLFLHVTQRWDKYHLGHRAN